MLQRLFYLIIIFLSACSTQTITYSQSEIDRLKADSLNSNKSASDLLTEYKSKIDSFGFESLSFYSPLNMAVADSNSSSAKHLLLTNQNKAKFHLLKALMAIDYASKNKIAVKLHLKKADTHFLALEKLEAKSIMPIKFSEIESEFSTLIKYIELGKIKLALNNEENLISQMLTLEIETLIRLELGESLDLIEKAIKLNADDYAQKSLFLAKQAVEETERFIRKSYRDRNGIKEKAKQTLDLSKKLFHVAEETYRIQSGSAEIIEEKVLSDFAFIEQIKEALNSKDKSISSYMTHQEKTINLLQTKQKEHSKNPELAECKEQKETLMDKVKELEQDILYQNRSVISKETNKAVLPELFE